MAPSSRFALSVKLNVAYLELNFCALWKKQTTLPSFAYAGIPYQVFGERAGALALMMAWSRSPIVRSGCVISAIFASASLSRASVFSSWALLHRGSFLVRELLRGLLFAHLVPSCAGSPMSYSVQQVYLRLGGRRFSIPDRSGHL